MIQIHPTMPVVVERGRDRPATGPIWVTIDGRPFPGAGWDDFVVVITAAMCDAVARLLSGRSRQEAVHFMDGPHKLVFTVDAPGGRLTMHSAGKEVDGGDCDVSAIAEQLLEHASRIEEIVEHTRDTSELIRARTALREAVNQACAHSRR